MILGLMAVTMMLISCGTTSQDSKNSARLYSNEYLYFQKGQKVQTAKGVVEFQVDSDYVAKWKYQDLERRVVAQEAEIRKLEAERDMNGP